MTAATPPAVPTAAVPFRNTPGQPPAGLPDPGVLFIALLRGLWSRGQNNPASCRQAVHFNKTLLAALKLYIRTVFPAVPAPESTDVLHLGRAGGATSRHDVLGV